MMDDQNNFETKHYESLTKEQLIEELIKRDRILLKRDLTLTTSETEVTNNHKLCKEHSDKLHNEEIARYSRQIILPEIRPSGQIKLKKSSVLIVGCGGLGCPAAMYLAAAGVGCIGLVDYDKVEISNLHRQVLHTKNKIGVSKSLSIASYISSLNSEVKTIPYEISLISTNAVEVISSYDIVLDCTDNVATRYLLNDACILADKPLVSGSALRFEGQLTVYHYEGGPCYRCLFPKPPPPETVTNCSDGGVLGVVPGIIGSLQALEAIKIICKIGSNLSQKLLLFDATQSLFRTIKLRPHQTSCEVCGDAPTIKELIDYEQFCGAKATDKEKGLSLLNSEDRITAEQFHSILERNIPHVLIDVRTPVELEIFSLPNSINIPIKKINEQDSIDLIASKVREVDAKVVYCICRRGNDSQIAASSLITKLSDLCYVRDIKGGLTAWAKTIDKTAPIY